MMKPIERFKEILSMGSAVCLASFLVANVAGLLIVLGIKICIFYYGLFKV